MNVYWTLCPSVTTSKTILSEIHYNEPENVFKNVIKNKNTKNEPQDYVYCPSFRDLLSNTYSIKFPFDYELTYGEGSIKSKRYDQKFFDEYVYLRSVPDKVISLNIRYLFFSEKSLEILLSSPYFSNNEFTKYNKVIPGKFDIGKWLRPIEIALSTSPEIDNIIMKRGDDAAYITFLTNEKINLKKFYLTDKIRHYVDHNTIARRYNNSGSNLQYLYDRFIMSKQKNFILKEIKDNLME